jgi:hypothetical protein
VDPPHQYRNRLVELERLNGATIKGTIITTYNLMCTGSLVTPGQCLCAVVVGSGLPSSLDHTDANTLGDIIILDWRPAVFLRDHACLTTSILILSLVMRFRATIHLLS